MKRKIILPILLALAVLLPDPAFAAETAANDAACRIIDRYYTAVKTVGAPHWNAGHSEETLKKYAAEGQYAKSVTNHQCPGRFYDSCTSNWFGGTTQCFGFAKYMCYLIYGTYPRYAGSVGVNGRAGMRDDNYYYFHRSVSGFPTLKTGDIFRWYGSDLDLHAAMIYSVNNGKMTLFDCNHIWEENGRCLIDKCQLDVGFLKSYYDSGNAYICRYSGPDRPVTLTVDPGNGEKAETVKQNGKEVEQFFTLPKNKTACPGFTFTGWALSPTALNAAYQPGTVLSLKKNTSVYGVWKLDRPDGRGVFKDVTAGLWFGRPVQYVVENGLMSGHGYGVFGPNEKLSRAQLAQVLYNREGRPETEAAVSFEDLAPGAWYTDAVAWAAERGLVNGCSSEAFRPDRSITREQLASILYRYAGTPETEGSLESFTDAGEVSPYAQDAMRWAVEQGILEGKGKGILSPQGKATRAEAAAMLQRFFGKAAAK